MNQRSAGVRRGGLIVLTVGLLLLVPAVIALVSSLSFLGKAERAEAIFGGAVLRNSSYGMMYYPEFTFQTKDGRDMTFRSRIGSSDQEYAPGAKIAVLYDPTYPEHMEADTLLGVWLLPVHCRRRFWWYRSGSCLWSCSSRDPRGPGTLFCFWACARCCSVE